MRKRRLLSGLLALLLTALPAGAESALTVTFLDIGKADTILLRTENSAVLIDAGMEEDGDAVLQMLAAQGVEALDALIITHYDKDHVGGADAVLSAIPVRRVLDPAYEKGGKQVREFIEAALGAGVEPESLTENIAFELDGLRYEIDVANKADYGEEEENDFSLVTRVTCGTKVFLFAGDAENPRLKELLKEGSLAADVLKVPHHGKYEKKSLPFFEAVGAHWGVITSSDEEPEDEETLEALRAAGTEPLLTREGTIIMTCDGQEIQVTQE